MGNQIDVWGAVYGDGFFFEPITQVRLGRKQNGASRLSGLGESILEVAKLLRMLAIAETELDSYYRKLPIPSPRANTNVMRTNAHERGRASAGTKHGDGPASAGTKHGDGRASAGTKRGDGRASAGTKRDGRTSAGTKRDGRTSAGTKRGDGRASTCTKRVGTASRASSGTKQLTTGRSREHCCE